MAENTTTTPSISGTIDQKFFLTPLNGPDNPSSYLDNFPDAVYGKSIDGHLVKFMYSLMGPSGLGWIQKNYLDARLLLEDYGIEGFDLDRFYGDPLKFGRILEETYERDLSGLISREKWNEIKAKDAKYRSRALNYIAGIRAGNTPLGMELIAKSGLGHDASVTENYRYLYDQHSDDRLELEYKGATFSTEEMIVAPRQEIPQSEVQKVEFFGTITGGFFTAYLPVGDPNNQSSQPIGWNASNEIVRILLEGIPGIGKNNVLVEGGPLPSKPITVKFINELSYKDIPELQIDVSDLEGDTLNINAQVTTVADGATANGEPVAISTRDQRYLLTALDYIKPVTSIVTFVPGQGSKAARAWTGTPQVSSQYAEVVRYVTGRSSIKWPNRDSVNWIESGVEHKAVRAFNDLQYHYQGFHNSSRTKAYTEEAVEHEDYETKGWSDDFLPYRSEHIGNFTNLQRLLYPHLNVEYTGFAAFSSDKAIALYPEPLVTTASNTSGEGIPTQLVNGIYPASYLNLPGVAPSTDSGSRFWASKQRTEGTEYLEIDLGTVQAINYLTFEISNKPCDIEICYDVLDAGESRKFVPVTHDPDFPVSDRILFESARQTAWRPVEYLFGNQQNNMVYTRYIRVALTRNNGIGSPFIDSQGVLSEHSLEIKNLRVGRNI